MILYVNACARRDSRTARMAGKLLSVLGGEQETVKLSDDALPPLDEEILAYREEACARGDFSGRYFSFARQFAAAEEIVIAAPYWDLSFPAVLKKYLEAVCIRGLTFRYTASGVPAGLCRAKKLYYITTAGGTIGAMNFGYDYVKALAQGLFGIEDCVCYVAENLDAAGENPETLLALAQTEMIATLAPERKRPDADLSAMVNQLRGEHAWQPAGFSCEVSDADAAELKTEIAAFIAHPDDDAMKAFTEKMWGSTLWTIGRAYPDGGDFVPELMRYRTGSEYFPVFTSETEMGQFGARFEHKRLPMTELVALFRDTGKKSAGLVINPFTDSAILRPGLFGLPANED